MPKFRVMLEIEAAASHTIEVVGQSEDEGIANAIDAVRIGMRIDPMKYLRQRKVDVEAVFAEEVEGTEEI